MHRRINYSIGCDSMTGGGPDAYLADAPKQYQGAVTGCLRKELVSSAHISTLTTEQNLRHDPWAFGCI